MRDDDLYLQDDPYLIECARWRAVLADPQPSRVRRVKRRAQWPHWALAIGLGAMLGALLTPW